MAVFSYKVRATTGNIINGTMDAVEQRAAIDQLKKQKYIVLEIHEVKANALMEMVKKFNPFKGKVTAKDLVLFSRQLSTLVSAGVPLVQGLTMLGDQIENPVFKKTIENVRSDIESGISIADALGRHPDAFTTLYVSMIRAGEIGGILDTILERLSGYLEAAEELKAKVKGAMVYPTIVLTIALSVTIFLLVAVIPTFRAIFEGFGADLPLPTKILIGLSDLLKKYILVIIIAPIIFVVVFMQWYKTPAGKIIVDTQSLKLPLFGLLLKKVAVAKFTRTLGTLIKSGVPIMQALETVAQTAGNKIVEISVMKIRESIREGERISEPLKRAGLFPSMVVQMVIWILC